MRPVSVVVRHVFGKYSLEIAVPEDQHSIETLTAHRTGEAFGEGFGPWSPDRGPNDPDALRLKDLIETRGEFGISVPDQDLDRMSPVGQHHGPVAGLLDSPRSSRVCRDPHHVHPSGVEFDKEEHV